MKNPMVGKKLWMFVCLVVFLAGCGGSKASGPSAQAPSGDFNGAPPAQFESSKSASAPSPQAGSVADSSSRSRPSEPSPPPESRPGLGTEFGEARTSRVHDVTFVREAGRPFAIAALNYNDRRGVEALASAASRGASSRSVATGGGAVTIAIRDANGDPLEAVRAGDRTFVIGQAGQRYSIVLQNHTSHRFEAVGTVDGLDVINGKPGTFDNRGYVLLPFATLEIEGFRTSTAQVAAFRFAAVADSYAAQTGNARNVGVIGIAFFSERGDSFVPESETRLRDTASPFPADPRFAPPPPRR
ncbi:hypothetical protein BH11MYX4_BH11MYX4_66600 [soil metagenome]